MWLVRTPWRPQSTLQADSGYAAREYMRLTVSVSPLLAHCTLRRAPRSRRKRRCLTDLADECAVNNGGCWKGDYTVKGSRQTFSACKDELESYRVRSPTLCQELIPTRTPPLVCAGAALSTRQLQGSFLPCVDAAAP